jgi:hypothetical protein
VRLSGQFVAALRDAAKAMDLTTDQILDLLFPESGPRPSPETLELRAGAAKQLNQRGWWTLSDEWFYESPRDRALRTLD